MGVGPCVRNENLNFLHMLTDPWPHVTQTTPHLHFTFYISLWPRWKDWLDFVISILLFRQTLIMQFRMTSRSSFPTSASWAFGPCLANNLLWNTDRERQNHTKQFCIYKEEKEMLSLGRLSENGWEWGAIEEQMWIKFSVPEEAERKEHANRKIWIKLAI